MDITLCGGDEREIKFDPATQHAHLAPLPSECFSRQQQPEVCRRVGGPKRKQTHTNNLMGGRCRIDDKHTHVCVQEAKKYKVGQV